MLAIQQNQTLDLVRLPKGRKAVGCKWSIRSKKELMASLEDIARLVAKGFSQRKSMDFKKKINKKKF